MAVKTITVGEFSAKAHMYVGDVLGGDVVRVDCDEAGDFYVVDGPEDKIMRDALEAIVRLGAAGKLPKEYSKFLE